MVWPTSILPFQNGVEASTLYKPQNRACCTKWFLFIYHILYTIEWKLCPPPLRPPPKNKKDRKIYDSIKYFFFFLQNTTSSQMCHNVPEWGRVRLTTLGWSGPIAAQCGLSTRSWLIKYHIFLNMLTHNSLTCDTFDTRSRSIVQSNWPSVMQPVLHPNQCI